MGKKISITAKLLLSYGALAVCILAVGLLAYTVAAQAIMESYRTSVKQSLEMLGEYMEYGLENASTQAVTYLADAEMGNYLSGRMAQGDRLSYYNRTRTNLLNKASADLFISNLYLLSDQAPSLSTGNNSLEKTYSVFLETPQGQEALAENQSFLWFGRIPEVDEMFGVNPDSYAVRMVKQFYRMDAAILIDIDKGVIQDILTKAAPGEGSSALFVTGDGRVLRQDGSSPEGVYGSEFYQAAVNGGEESGTIENVEFGGTGNLFIYRRIADTDAMVCVLLPNALLTSQVSGIQYVTAGALIISGMLALIIALKISLGMNRTVSHMVRNMGLIAQGDMDVRMQLAGEKEFVRLSEQMNRMLDGVSALLSRIKTLGGGVSDSANLVNGSSFSIKEATRRITDVMGSLEEGMSDQAQDTAACCMQLEGLAGQIGEVAERAQDIRAITENTKTCIQNSGDAIDSLKQRARETSQITYSILESIGRFREKSQKIDQIIQVVYGIADETGLLSLNASIESARAGEQGQGFSVIAEEIRKLADQTMAATREIGEIVDDISATTLAMVQTAGQAEKIIGRQDESVDNAMAAFSDMLGQLGQLMEKVARITGSAVSMGSQKEAALRSMENISQVTRSAVASVQTVNERTVLQEEEVEKLMLLSDEMQKQVMELEEALRQFKMQKGEEK